MASDTYSVSLRLQLQGYGNNSNTWGGILDTQLQLVEAAITGDNGYAGGSGGININGLTAYSLTVNQGTADQARQLLYPFVGTLTANCTVSIPGVVKIGWALNATSGGYAVVLQVSGAGASVTLPSGCGWTLFYCDGTNVTVPTMNVSTLQPTKTFLTSGTGTYNKPPNAKRLQIRMVGGGAGGSGSGPSPPLGGGSGTDTTFGSSFLRAGGATNSVYGGTGGTYSIGSGAIGWGSNGAQGIAIISTTTGTAIVSSQGASTPFGPGGNNNGASQAGAAAGANTGAGGGGAGIANGGYSGASGAAGGYVDAIIDNPAASYSYSIGVGGTAGIAGTGGSAGGAGGSGYIEITEMYV
jgi:hypothetical protein